MEHIESIAIESLNLTDDWEYRRLLELAEGLSPELLQLFVGMGRESENPEIREAAEDFTKKLFDLRSGIFIDGHRV